MCTPWRRSTSAIIRPASGLSPGQQPIRRLDEGHRDTEPGEDLGELKQSDRSPAADRQPVGRDPQLTPASGHATLGPPPEHPEDLPPAAHGGRERGLPPSPEVHGCRGDDAGMQGGAGG